jgi:hypothetical protein
MIVKRLCAAALWTALSVGCQSPISGTWTAGSEPGADNPIAGVTFCHDGTFTANADYGSGRIEAMSGCYRVAGDELTLCTADAQRTYGVSVDGDTLNITHKDNTQMLKRMACKCTADCCALCCPAK